MWLTKAFRDQDAEEIVTQVKEFDRDNLFLKQQLGRDTNDLVLEQLRQEVKEFGVNNNLILALGNRALEQKHWEQMDFLLLK